MSEVEHRQMQFGETVILDICINPKSRDDIQAVLKALELNNNRQLLNSIYVSSYIDIWIMQRSFKSKV